MNLDAIDKIVVMNVDTRWPKYAEKTVGLLLEHGARPGSVEVFLNGRGLPRVDRLNYDMVHDGEAPEGWKFTRNAWDYCRAYRAVIRRAYERGDEQILVVEDDIEFSPNFRAVMDRAEVPEDWQLLYYSAFHWGPAPKVARYVHRCTGHQLGTQAVGWRRGAMAKYLSLADDRAVDCLLAGFQEEVPSYVIHPGVIRQQLDVASSIDGEQFAAEYLYEIRE